ncbi:Hsp20/alpha crystallin family protein [Thiomonas sp.]
MVALSQLRDNFNHVLESIAEGWRRLYRRASSAITRFTPNQVKSEGEIRSLVWRNAGWGVLAAEVCDDDDKILVRLEVPGMDKADFDIQVVPGYLVVSGEKRIEEERIQGRYHMTECAYGSFQRAIPLPAEVEVRNASARYKDGVLRVELPKTHQARQRRVSVEVK